jgi:hypothetical protein
LRAEFVAARSELQFVSKKTYNAYFENVEKYIKSDPKAFFKFVDLKKNRVGLPSVMKFKDEVATTTETKCELFAKFIQSSYANDEWEPSDPGREVLSDEIPLGSLQLSVTEVECALMDLDANKVPSSDKSPPSKLKKCATGFASPLCLIFNRSLSTCVFPAQWKLFFVTPLF